MGFQIGDDRVPGRGRVTTLMSHQSEILHSLVLFVTLNARIPYCHFAVVEPWSIAV